MCKKKTTDAPLFVSYLKKEPSNLFIEKTIKSHFQLNRHLEARLKKSTRFLETFKFKLIEGCFLSAKLFHPGATCILLSDYPPPKDTFSFPVKVIPPKSEKFMVEKFLVWSQFLSTHPIKGPVFLIDWDLVFQDNLLHIFHSKCDLYFTYNKLQADEWRKINCGLIALKEEKAIDASKLFAYLANKIDSFFLERYKHWYGDQFILWQAFKKYEQKILKEQTANLETDLKEVFKCSFLDSDLYNYKPLNTSCFFPEKKVLHFKGALKPEMYAYLEKFFPKLWEMAKRDPESFKTPDSLEE